MQMFHSCYSILLAHALKASGFSFMDILQGAKTAYLIHQIDPKNYCIIQCQWSKPKRFDSCLTA